MNKVGAGFCWDFDAVFQPLKARYQFKLMKYKHYSHGRTQLTLTRPNISTAADIPMGILV
ncbi:hypothetical protein OIHEL45_04175 [Sulfitobacter indolifex HEL-45]|uniref:Uncharacterized protein n=1 Tax=Sulfitobacter indolifex HEL-45 TaxID=391624 RepID=A0ABM9X8U9_9RHOB|nr:hypothetical protein OIHEL45_04175 [Sulfitobacter indolifex HEL-45]